MGKTQYLSRVAFRVVLIAVTAAFATVSSTLVRAQDTGNALKRFLYDDAEVTVHLRSYYLDRTNPAPPNNVGWAGGGWVGYETGWLFGAVRLGIVVLYVAASRGVGRHRRHLALSCLVRRATRCSGRHVESSNSGARSSPASASSSTNLRSIRRIIV